MARFDSRNVPQTNNAIQQAGRQDAAYGPKFGQQAPFPKIVNSPAVPKPRGKQSPRATAGTPPPAGVHRGPLPKQVTVKKSIGNVTTPAPNRRTRSK